MSDLGGGATVRLTPAESLAQLRVDAVPLHDPLGWAYLEALAKRWEVSNAEVQKVLDKRWALAVSVVRERASEAKATRRAQMSANLAAGAQKLDATSARGKLAALAHEARRAALPASASEDERPVLRSAARFHEMWERIGAEQALEEAFGRAPENAGPLNPHMLVLKTLRQMQNLSPAYLQRFMTHAEGLLWVSEAQASSRSGNTKGRTGAGSRKTRRR